MSQADAAEQGREPEQPTRTGAGGGSAGDGFPEEDVAPEETDPDLDVNDPFAVGDDRDPLEPDSDDGSDDGSARVAGA